MKMVKRRGYAYYTLMTSYILLFVIATSGYILMYLNAKIVVKHQMKEFYENGINQLCIDMDNVVLNVENFAYSIAADADIKSLLTMDEKKLQAKEKYKIAEIIGRIKTQMSISDSVDKLYIYISKLDMIIDDNSKYSSKEYYEFNKSDINQSYEEWIKTMLNHPERTYTSLGKENDIYYVRSLPMNTNLLATAAIVIKLNNDKIENSAKSFDMLANGTVCIIGEHNDLLYSGNSEISSNISQRLYNLEKNGQKIEIKGERFIVSSVGSNVSKIRYLSIASYDAYTEKLNSLAVFFFASMTIMLLIFIWLILYFFNKNYSNINRIVNMICEKFNFNYKEKQNEYELIVESIEHFHKEKLDIFKKLRTQNDKMKYDIVADVVSGRQDLSYLDVVADKYEFNKVKENYCLLAVYINGFSDLFYEQNEGCLEQEKKETCLFIIENVLSELLSKNHSVFCCIIDNLLHFIISADEIDVFELSEIYNSASQFIFENFGIFFSVISSNIRNSRQSCGFAFCEVSDTILYAARKNESGFIKYCDISTEIKTANEDAGNMENRIANCIAIGEWKSLINITEKYFYNLEMAKINDFVKKCRIYVYFNILFTEFSKIKDGEIKNMAVSLFSSYTGDFTDVDIENIKNKIVKMLNVLDDNSIREKNERKSRNLSEIKEYICENYFDAELSLAKISDKFGYNPSYLSRIFKTGTGEGINDYINSIRIKNSIELLKNDDLAVKDIAEMCGYANSISFNRVFKKYEGLAPGQYREKLNSDLK